VQILPINSYQLYTSSLTRINELTNPDVCRAHERTCRSSKKTSQREHVLDSLPHLYLFDEGPVHPKPSVTQHHNSQPRRSETLTLRHSIRCRPATTEIGNRIPSEICMVDRSTGAIPCFFATFLVYQKCMHIRIGGPVSLGVWYWLVGDKSDCSPIMHTRDASYENRFLKKFRTNKSVGREVLFRGRCKYGMIHCI